MDAAGCWMLIPIVKLRSTTGVSINEAMMCGWNSQVEFFYCSKLIELPFIRDRFSLKYGNGNNILCEFLLCSVTERRRQSLDTMSAENALTVALQQYTWKRFTRLFLCRIPDTPVVCQPNSDSPKLTGVSLCLILIGKQEFRVRKHSDCLVALSNHRVQKPQCFIRTY